MKYCCYCKYCLDGSKNSCTVFYQSRVGKKKRIHSLTGLVTTLMRKKKPTRWFWFGFFVPCHAFNTGSVSHRQYPWSCTSIRSFHFCWQKDALGSRSGNDDVTERPVGSLHSSVSSQNKGRRSSRFDPGERQELIVIRKSRVMEGTHGVQFKDRLQTEYSDLYPFIFQHVEKVWTFSVDFL